MLALVHTNHSAYRSAQRGLSEEEIEYVYQFASRHHAGGALIFYLRKQDIPVPDRRLGWVDCLVGTALVVERHGATIITAWRNRRCGLKIIRKKENERHSNTRRRCEEFEFRNWTDRKLLNGEEPSEEIALD